MHLHMASMYFTHTHTHTQSPNNHNRTLRSGWLTKVIKRKAKLYMLQHGQHQQQQQDAFKLCCK